MPTDNHNRTIEEIARLGDDIYERTIRERVQSAHYGRVVAIAVNSGEYEVGDNGLAASRALLERVPDAVIWCMRVGDDALYRIGRHFCWRSR